MRFVITFVSLIFVVVLNVNAQTTLSSVSVNGQNYDVTYRTGVVFDDYETTIDDAPWWNASSSQANDFASAANVNNLRFAYKTGTVFGTAAVYYATSNTTDIAAQNASADYAISAVAVPAPLPILGILPVVGFLKRMRKRQRA